MTEFPAGWLVAAATAINGTPGKAEPADLEAARRVLEALRREGALCRLAPVPRGCGSRRRGMDCDLPDGHFGRHGRSAREEWS